MHIRIWTLPLTVLIGIISAVEPAALAQQKGTRKQTWSVDLRDYGATRTILAAAPGDEVCEPKFSMAATSEVVGVAIAKADPEVVGARAFCLAQPWLVHLLFFDAVDGKLLSQSGPWTSSYRFELYAAPGDNFLLHYQQHHAVNDRFNDVFVLASSTGTEVKKSNVEPISERAHGGWDRVLVSPSGRTVYISEPGDDGLHCKIILTESLSEQRVWVEPLSSSRPHVFAISDREMLGASRSTASGATREAKAMQTLSLRTFGSDWHELAHTAVLSPTRNGSQPDSITILSPSYGFTADDRFFVSERIGEDDVVRILRSDGTILSTPNLPKNSHAIRFPIASSISQDGRYFLLLGARENWGNHLMLDVLKWDDTFWNDDAFVYVWQTERPDPVRKIDLGAGKVIFVVTGGDSPGVAYVRETKLRFKRVQPELIK